MTAKNILEVTSVRCISTILYQRKCDDCEEKYFISERKMKSGLAQYCSSCFRLHWKEKRVPIVGLRIINSKNVSPQSYKHARGSKKNYKKILKSDNYICQYCLESGDSIDHVLPVTAGGDNRMSNLVCCCGRCNSIASNLVFPSFVEKARYIREKIYK